MLILSQYFQGVKIILIVNAYQILPGIQPAFNTFLSPLIIKTSKKTGVDACFFDKNRI